jgi:multidrug efflux pump
MFVGTLFTLFVVPSIYMLIARDHGKDRERDSLVAEAGGAVAGEGEA